MNETPIAPSTPPVPTPPQAPPLTSPVKKSGLSAFGAIMFGTLFPAILLVPLWVVLGRLLFGVGGWMMIVMFFTVGPILLIYHIILVIIGSLGAQKATLSLRSSIALLVYYVSMIILGFSLVDGGDTPSSVGSVLTFMGMPELLNDALYYISVCSGIVAGIVVVVFLSLDIAKKHREKNKVVPTAPAV